MIKPTYETEIPEDVKEFIEKTISEHDYSKMEYIKFVRTKARYTKGYCYYPISARKANKWVRLQRREKYAIVCRIPDTIHVEIYRHVQEWLATEIVEGGRLCRKLTAVKSESLEITDRNEQIIWLWGHERHHFLRHSRQVSERNSQNQANKAGMDLIKTWREWKKAEEDHAANVDAEIEETKAFIESAERWEAENGS